MARKTRIMYIEYKGDGIVGSARIGRVTFSKSSRSIHYKEKTFLSLKGSGFKANYFDADTREEYWISGCKKNGGDALYSNVIEIDEDAREEYWVQIRNKPELKQTTIIKGESKY